MEIPVEKNQEYVVEIIDQGYEGEGIAKINQFTLFIPGAIKGETCKVMVVKVMTSHAFAKLIEIISPSENRVSLDCETYKRCGGCDLRHMTYDNTLELKKEMVQNLVDKMLNTSIKVKSVLGMKEPYHYRNKAQYPIGIGKDQKPVIGVYAQRTHEIIPIKHCFIQNEVVEEIATFIYDFILQNKISVYNEETKKGTIRHIVVKVGIYTKEIMCIIVTNTKQMEKEKELVQSLVEQFPNIKTIIKNINMQYTNVILGKENIVLYGEGIIEDTLGDYTFKISPLSFYQVNPIQAEVLYNTAIKLANLSKEDILFDLYCGIGTIGIFASPYVKKVYGIEIVEQAIQDAKENAKRNNIKNIEFLVGDVEKVFGELIHERKVIPDVILVDPPRKGLDEKTIGNILAIHPKKMIYISCNPATMVRDMKLLEEQYDIQEIRPVDMFPYTKHVETVTLLTLRTG